MLFPMAAFRLFGIHAPNYPEFWQFIGMIAACFGVGFWIASSDPVRHWLMIAVGLVGGILTPLGFWSGVERGHLPASATWMIALHDVIWWVPFAAILWQVRSVYRQRRLVASPEIQRMALRTRTQFGVSLLEMSQLSPVMVIFLRHFGCTFCREAVADLASRRREIEQQGVRLAFVHMSSEEEADDFFVDHGLADVARVSDPKQIVYRAFGLERGSWGQLFGPKVLWRGIQAGFLEGRGVGRPVGDAFQMPGVFVIFHGEVLRAYRHQSAADRPDYVALASEQGYPIPS